MALSYIKTKVLTPYDRTILPITLAEFKIFGDKQGAYDTTDPDTAGQVNKYIEIVRNNLEFHINAPLLSEEWEYTAFADTPYQQFDIYLPHIRDFNKVSIKTSELDTSNQYIWYDIPAKDWYSHTEDELSIKHNIVSVQSDTEVHKALNTNPSNKNIEITFSRGVYNDVNTIPPEIKKVIAQVSYNMLEGVEVFECTIEALVDAIRPYKNIYSF